MPFVYEMDIYLIDQYLQRLCKQLVYHLCNYSYFFPQKAKSSFPLWVQFTKRSEFEFCMQPMMHAPPEAHLLKTPALLRRVISSTITRYHTRQV